MIVKYMINKSLNQMFYSFNLNAYIRFLVKIVTETNVNTSKEFHISEVYRSKNYKGVHVNFASDPL